MKPPIDLADKGAEVEEWLDLRFFRPLGYWIAKALQPTRVSANQVTLWSLATGLVAGHLFYYAGPWPGALGFVLFIISDIFDSADGQLARLRSVESRFGRIVDGLADNLRFANLYLTLMARLAVQGRNWFDLLLVLAAGLSQSLQGTSVDFIRLSFLSLGPGHREPVELPEEVAVPRQGSLFQKLAAFAYRAYVRRQSWMFPRSMELERRLRQGLLPEQEIRSCRLRQRAVVNLCAWQGHNIRFGLLGAAAVLGWIEGYLWVTVTVMNILLLVSVALYEGNARNLLETVRSDALVTVAES